MAHLQASSRYLALLLCFVPVLALAQQPMTIGVKGYATGLTFEESGDFGMTAQSEPAVHFTNTLITGFGITFERKSPAGFQWALEAGRLFEKHTADIEGLGPVRSLEIPIYLASVQFGYRWPLRERLSVAAFTGATYQFNPDRTAGLGRTRTSGDYEFDIFQSFSNSFFLPLRLDVSWSLTEKWSVSGGAQLGLPLELRAFQSGYFIRVRDSQNNEPTRRANYSARQHLATFSVGINYHLQ